MTDDPAQIRALAVTSSEEAVDELHAIFAHSRWRLDTVSSLAESPSLWRDAVKAGVFDVMERPC